MATAAPEEVVLNKPETEVSNKPETKEPPPAVAMEKPNDVVQDKPVAPPPHDDAAAKALVAKAPEPAGKKSSKGSLDRDVALAKLEDEKRVSFIKAWEESEKSKVENKAQKKLSDVAAWENSKKAALESQLRSIEEKLEKQKAEYGEKIKNKVALIHKQAEEKRAMVEARRGEDFLKAEEMAAKYRATGHVPKKAFGCFGG